MELTKQPQTEMEYWEVIEDLGGYIWHTKHDLGHGRYKITNEIEKSLKSAEELLGRLVTELSEKFNVIHPKDCPKFEAGKTQQPAPEGKTYYWDWYRQMKREFYRNEYEKLICSACPLSEGLEQMISLGGVIPCGVWRGALYRLRLPYECAMTATGIWNNKELHTEINQRGDEEALTKFLAKESELKQAFEKKAQ